MIVTIVSAGVLIFVLAVSFLWLREWFARRDGQPRQDEMPRLRLYLWLAGVCVAGGLATLPLAFAKETPIFYGLSVFLYIVLLAGALGLAIRAMRATDAEPGRSGPLASAGWDPKA